MKNGQVAVALTSGYLLGRTRKLRWALALASAAAGRRLASGRGAIGSELLKSPELSRLTQDVRKQLMTAGRTAAVNAASHRIDALSDRLEQRTNALRRGPGGEEPEQEEPDTEREASQEQPEEERPERGRKPEAEQERHPQKQRPSSSSPHARTARKAGESGGAARKSAGAKKSTSSRTTQGNRR